jgi:hypothetical protein
VFGVPMPIPMPIPMGSRGLGVGWSALRGLPSSFLGWPQGDASSVLTDRGRSSGARVLPNNFGSVPSVGGLEYFRG